MYIFFKKLAKERILHLFLPPIAISYDNQGHKIYINNCYIPLKYSSFRNFLLKFNLLSSTSSHLHEVQMQYSAWFIQAIVPLMESSETFFTLEQLSQKQQQQAECGLVAEQYVIQLEKAKFSKHPYVEKIRLISDKYVSAGYDIKSFMGESSVVLDKEIEVKSYTGEEPSFYWSRNEICRAESSGDCYFLYLVNRGFIHDENYQPIIIQNPFKNVLNSNNWERTIESSFFKYL